MVPDGPARACFPPPPAPPILPPMTLPPHGPDEVRRIAALARIRLTDEEAERLARDFGSILGYVDRLRARDEADGVWCWGTSPSENLGAPLGPLPTPARLDVDVPLRTVSVGAGTLCGTDASDLAWCWGENEHGQLGDGTLAPRDQPVRPLTLTAVQSLSTSGGHTCAVQRSSDAAASSSNRNVVQRMPGRFASQGWPVFGSALARL